MVESAVPEIGPYLGRLAEIGFRFPDPTVGLDQIRLDLVSDLFARVAAARRLEAGGDGRGARAAVAPEVWLAAWRKAAAAAAAAVSAAIDTRLHQAARTSRFPGLRLKGLLPNAEDRAVTAAKLDAAGIVVEQAAARVEGGEATGLTWADGLRQLAVSIEDAWEDLEGVARRELERIEPVAARVAAWRPALAPWVTALTVTGLVVLWVSLTIGGQVPRPRWLDPVAAWFWSLPWP